MDILDSETTVLGQELRNFQSKICPAFETRELRKEANSRNKKAADRKSKSASEKKKPVGKSKSSGKSNSKLVDPPGVNDEERKLIAFSLDTYKAHSLGDYVDTIKQLGTTDSFSTEVVREPTYNLLLAQQSVF